MHCDSGLPAHRRPLSRPGVVSAPAGRREEDSDGSTHTCERGALGSGTMALGGRRGRATPGLESKYRHWQPAILLQLIPSFVTFPPLPAPYPFLPFTLHCTHPRTGPSPCQASQAGEGWTALCGPPVLGPYLSPVHWGPSVPWSSGCPLCPLFYRGSLPPLAPLGHLGSPVPWITWGPPPVGSPGSLSVPLPPLTHFFGGEPFLLLQLLL